MGGNTGGANSTTMN